MAKTDSASTVPTPRFMTGVTWTAILLVGLLAFAFLAVVEPFGGRTASADTSNRDAAIIEDVTEFRSYTVDVIVNEQLEQTMDLFTDNAAFVVGSTHLLNESEIRGFFSAFYGSSDLLSYEFLTDHWSVSADGDTVVNVTTAQLVARDRATNVQSTQIADDTAIYVRSADSWLLLSEQYSPRVTP